MFHPTIALTKPTSWAFLLPVAALLLTNACASPKSAYPSLAIRDSEAVSVELPVVQTVPTPVFTASSLEPARIDALKLQAASAHQEFLAALPGARSTIARGTGARTGSANWARSQVAYAQLRDLRSQTLVALADLDRFFVDAASQGLQSDTLDAAQAQVEAMLNEQDAQLAALNASQS